MTHRTKLDDVASDLPKSQLAASELVEIIRARERLAQLGKGQLSQPDMIVEGCEPC